MALLNFSDILRKAGLDPAKVQLIRHTLNDKEFRACYEKNILLNRRKILTKAMITGRYLSAEKGQKQDFISYIG